jgi:hypothetical protein
MRYREPENSSDYRFNISKHMFSVNRIPVISRKIEGKPCAGLAVGGLMLPGKTT